MKYLVAVERSVTFCNRGPSWNLSMMTEGRGDLEGYAVYAR